VKISWADQSGMESSFIEDFTRHGIVGHIGGIVFSREGIGIVFGGNIGEKVFVFGYFLIGRCNDSAIRRGIFLKEIVLRGFSGRSTKRGFENGVGGTWGMDLELRRRHFLKE